MSARDLEELAALAAGGPAAQARPDAAPAGSVAVAIVPARRTGGNGGGGDALGDADASVLADLEQLQRLAGSGGWKRKFEQRSHELLDHARRCRREKGLEVQLKRHRATIDDKDRLLQVAVASRPELRKVLGVRGQPAAETLAALEVRTACSPGLRGHGFRGQALAQARSCHLVAEALLHFQHEYVSRLGGAEDPCECRIVALHVQWDETSQRLRPFKDTKGGARSTRMHVASQVMVCSGFFRTSVHERGGNTSITEDPWHARPLRLFGQDTNYILHGLATALPIGFSTRTVEDILSKSDAFLVCIAMDRASVNFTSAAWITQWLRDEFGDRAMVYPELCVSHGCSLVKQRCPVSKGLATSLYSFTRWLRVSRNFDDFSQAIHDLIAENMEVRQEQRPVNAFADSMRVVECLYGCQSSTFLWRANSKGKLEKTRLLQDLESLCKVIDLSACGKSIIFFNLVGPESDEHLVEGKSVGSQITASREEAVERVAEALLSVLMGSAWVTCTESRWTHVATTVKRFLLGMAPFSLLVGAMRYVQVRWDLNMTMEEELAALIKQDAQDFSSRNKVRLLRMIRTFDQPHVKCHLCLLLIVGGCVENVQYALLGHAKARARARLGDLLHPGKSPIVQCQRDLYALAQDFHSRDGSPWFLLAIFGIDFGDQKVRMEARRHILQLSAGMLHVFELRYAGWPHQLAWLTFPESTPLVKQTVFRAFRRHSKDCLDSFSRSLMNLCADEVGISTKGMLVISSWLASSVSIDFSERTHAALRRDLTSSGGAANFADAADRLLVRQFVADFVELGGVDPASARILDGQDATTAAAAPRKREGVGSNPFLLFHNLRMETQKALLAPGRKLTPEERLGIEENIKSEWERESADAEKLGKWVELYQQRHRPPQQRALLDMPTANSEAIVPSSGQASKTFIGLWGAKTEMPHHLLQVKDLMQFKETKPNVKREPIAERVQRLVVKDVVPDRKSEIRGDARRTVHGCHSTVNNICLIHGVASHRVRALESLKFRLQYWYGSLSKQARTDASELLLFDSVEGDGLAVSVAVLLVLTVDKPKGALWAHCTMQDEGVDGGKVFPQPTCPFKLRIMSETPRLCRRDGLGHDFRAFALATTLELSSLLLDTRPTWHIKRCNYDIGSGETLLEMEVTATTAVPDPPARAAPVRKTAAAGLPPEIDLGDPWTYGERQCSRGAGCGVIGASADEKVDEAQEPIYDSDDSFAEEAGGIAEPTEEMREEMLEDLFEVGAAVAAAPLFDEVETATPLVADDGDREPHEALVCEAAVAAAVGEEAAEEDPIAAAIRMAEVGEQMGYVNTGMQPWCEKRPCGRITFWPSGNARMNQNVAIKCYMHSNCSVSRSAKNFSQEQCLRWLFDSQPLPPSSSTAEKKQAGAAHMARAATLLPRVTTGRLPPNSQGGAASGSGDPPNCAGRVGRRR